MELCINDRRLSNPDGFPEHITPFPEPLNSFYAHQTAAASSLDVRNDLYFPPQKLRPIRSNGKNHQDYSETLMNRQSSDDRGLSVNNCTNMFGVSTPELGHVGNQLRQLCQDGNDCYGGTISGNGFWQIENIDLQSEVRSMFGATVYENVKAETRVSQTETSSSSDYNDIDIDIDNGNDNVNDSNISFENISENRKRKRRKKKKLQTFMENMVAKVMQRQEEMHNQLIQLIERKEKERILREEAWKRQEIERAKREEDLRAQEASRNLAMMSLIQNLLGNQFQSPQPLRIRSSEEDQADAASVDDVDTNETQGRCDSLSNKKWSKSEVQALIAVRTALDNNFRSMGSTKGSLWEEISSRLASVGYNRTAKKCKEKWENMNKYFRKTLDGGKLRGENGKTCPYFHELELLYKAGLENPAEGANDGHDEKIQEGLKQA